MLDRPHPPPNVWQSPHQVPELQNISVGLSLPISDLKLTFFSGEPGSGPIYGHYDLRYYPGQPISEEERHHSQRNLIAAYLATMRALGYETWLAHGTLLGWWWNGQALPWDGDFDVQMWASSLPYLSSEYNMTTHDYTHNEMLDDGTMTEVTSTYLLDVNPHIDERTRGNWMNVIDARWIDTKNGLFIDITGLTETNKGVWSCKNFHHYRLEELYPLQETTFEGVRALVPNAFEGILRAEYGRQSLEATHFEGHSWNSEQQLWLKN